MSIVIVGGSGMLARATEWIKDNFDDDIWLLSRNQDRYSSELLNFHNVKFVEYDYETDNKIDYEYIKDVKIMVNWVHSNGYINHQSFIESEMTIDDNYTPVYIHIVGSNRHDDSAFIKWLQNKGFKVLIVQLGFRLDHQGGKRWLTHDEISDGVIQAIQLGEDVLVSE